MINASTASTSTDTTVEADASTSDNPHATSDVTAAQLSHCSRTVRARHALGAAQLIGGAVMLMPAALSVTNVAQAPQTAALMGAVVVILATALAASLGERGSRAGRVFAFTGVAFAVIAAGVALPGIFIDGVSEYAQAGAGLAVLAGVFALLVRLLDAVSKVVLDSTQIAGEALSFFPFLAPLYNQGVADWSESRTEHLHELAERLPRRV